MSGSSKEPGAHTRSTASSSSPANLHSPGIVECTCSEESARRRLVLEPDPSHPAHNRTFALYLETKARFEPITYPKVVISTDQPLEQCIEQALAAITAA